MEYTRIIAMGVLVIAEFESGRGLNAVDIVVIAIIIVSIFWFSSYLDEFKLKTSKAPEAEYN